jgi:hypothetical protein
VEQNLWLFSSLKVEEAKVEVQSHDANSTEQRDQVQRQEQVGGQEQEQIESAKNAAQEVQQVDAQAQAQPAKRADQEVEAEEGLCVFSLELGEVLQLDEVPSAKITVPPHLLAKVQVQGQGQGQA